MDLGLSDDVTESYQRFQGRLKREYDRMVDTDGFVVIDAHRPVEPIQHDLREDLRPLLQGFPTGAKLQHEG